MLFKNSDFNLFDIEEGKKELFYAVECKVIFAKLYNLKREFI